MSLGHCGGCLFWPSLLLVAMNLGRNAGRVVPEGLCFLPRCVEKFLTLKESFVLNF